MNAAGRRMEIISALMCRHHSTAAELAWEFGVCTRTIAHDISRLSYGYPIYTKQGASGGVFIQKRYKPYNNTLTPLELETMLKIYEAAGEDDKKILSQVISKYGPDKKGSAPAPLPFIRAPLAAPLRDRRILPPVGIIILLLTGNKIFHTASSCDARESALFGKAHLLSAYI